MYSYKLYRKYFPIVIPLHITLGLSIVFDPWVTIKINNDPKWLVITKVITYSAIWGVIYPLTYPIILATMYLLYF